MKHVRKGNQPPRRVTRDERNLVRLGFQPLFGTNTVEKNKMLQELSRRSRRTSNIVDTFATSLRATRLTHEIASWLLFQSYNTVSFLNEFWFKIHLIGLVVAINRSLNLSGMDVKAVLEIFTLIFMGESMQIPPSWPSGSKAGNGANHCTTMMPFGANI